MSAELKTEVRSVADVRILAVSGRIDFTNADDFAERMKAVVAETPAGTALVADLDALAFITSAGLRALALSAKVLKGAGSPFVVAGPKGVVAEVFQITKFDKVLAVEPTLREAVAKVSPAAASALDA